MPVTITDFLRENYVEANTIETLNLQPKKSQRTFYIIYGLVLLYYFISDYMVGKFPSGGFIGLFIFFIVLVFITLPRKGKLNFVYKKSSVTQVKVFVNNPDNQSFFSQKSYVASDAGMEITSSSAILKYFWTAFVKRRDTETHIFLFTDQVSILVFPKNKIASLAEFENLLSRHISFHAEVGRHIT